MRHNWQPDQSKFGKTSNRSPVATAIGLLFACVEPVPVELVVIFPVSAEGRSATWELLVELSICFPLC